MVGSRLGLDLLTVLGVEPVMADLVAAQLIDQVRFTRNPEYVFHHPLICAVAYESQLKSDRTELHRRLAVSIKKRDPDSSDAVTTDAEIVPGLVELEVAVPRSRPAVW